MVEETRAKLIRAARTAFAAKGYAAASMDDLTAEAGLTRGALYHNFGDKKGLLQAVIDQIDAEMLVRLRAAQERAKTPWLGFLDANIAYIEMALEPEIQRIMLLDGPAVLGDPSRLSQVIENLITNGLKYGNRQPVLVELYAFDGQVRIVVTDHGIGIASENIGRVLFP